MRRLIYNNKDQLMAAGVIVAGWDPVNGGLVYTITLGGSCLELPFAVHQRAARCNFGVSGVKLMNLNNLSTLLTTNLFITILFLFNSTAMIPVSVFPSSGQRANSIVLYAVNPIIL
jgi:hypothetical protein